MATIVILGASSGLGAGLADGLPLRGDRAWLVSRNPPSAVDRQDGVDRRWISADLSRPDATTTISKEIGTEPIDLLVYAAGTWESRMPLTDISSQEIHTIVATNLSGFIAIVATLAGNLRAGSAARVVAIGSTAGLENATGQRAAYAASKFGLRGATHALRCLLGMDGIGVTCLSPGGIATDVTFDEGREAALSRHQNRRIPISDFIDIINLIRTLSPAVCIKEIHMPAMFENV